MRRGRLFIDSDCHQIEPDGMWARYVDPKYKESVPQKIEIDGRAVLAVEGEPIRREGAHSYPAYAKGWSKAQKRGRKPTKKARDAGFTPAARLEDMDATGIDVQILNPTQGGQLLGREFKDPGLLVALCRAYNDWCAEYCAAEPTRLRWIAMIPLQEVEAAIEETHRSASMGAVGFYARPNPLRGRQIYSREYFPLWAAMEEEGRPVSVHDTGSPQLASFGDRMQTHTTGHILAHPLETMVSMMALIWYGIPEHFPKLNIVHVEGDSGWLPYWLQRMEQHYDFAGNSEHPDLEMRPTEYFERNVFVAARGDERTLPTTVDLVGDRNLMLNTDYPHADGHWPASLDAFDKQPIAEDSQARLLGTNALRAFGLEDEFKDHPGLGAKRRGFFSRFR